MCCEQNKLEPQCGKGQTRSDKQCVIVEGIVSNEGIRYSPVPVVTPPTTLCVKTVKSLAHCDSLLLRGHDL